MSSYKKSDTEVPSRHPKDRKDHDDLDGSKDHNPSSVNHGDPTDNAKTQRAEVKSSTLNNLRRIALDLERNPWLRKKIADQVLEFHKSLLSFPFDTMSKTVVLLLVYLNNLEDCQRFFSPALNRHLRGENPGTRPSKKASIFADSVAKSIWRAITGPPSKSQNDSSKKSSLSGAKSDESRGATALGEATTAVEDLMLDFVFNSGGTVSDWMQRANFLRSDFDKFQAGRKSEFLESKVDLTKLHDPVVSLCLARLRGVYGRDDNPSDQNLPFQQVSRDKGFDENFSNALGVRGPVLSSLVDIVGGDLYFRSSPGKSEARRNLSGGLSDDDGDVGNPNRHRSSSQGRRASDTGSKNKKRPHEKQRGVSDFKDAMDTESPVRRSRSTTKTNIPGESSRGKHTPSRSFQGSNKRKRGGGGSGGSSASGDKRPSPRNTGARKSKNKYVESSESSDDPDQPQRDSDSESETDSSFAPEPGDVESDDDSSDDDGEPLEPEVSSGSESSDDAQPQHLDDSEEEATIANDSPSESDSEREDYDTKRHRRRSSRSSGEKHSNKDHNKKKHRDRSRRSASSLRVSKDRPTHDTHNRKDVHQASVGKAAKRDRVRTHDEREETTKKPKSRHRDRDRDRRSLSPVAPRERRERTRSRSHTPKPEKVAVVVGDASGFNGNPSRVRQKKSRDASPVTRDRHTEKKDTDKKARVGESTRSTPKKEKKKEIVVIRDARQSRSLSPSPVKRKPDAGSNVERSLDKERHGVAAEQKRYKLNAQADIVQVQTGDACSPVNDKKPEAVVSRVANPNDRADERASVDVPDDAPRSNGVRDRDAPELSAGEDPV